MPEFKPLSPPLALRGLLLCGKTAKGERRSGSLGSTCDPPAPGSETRRFRFDHRGRADESFGQRTVDEARAKPNHNPSYKPVVPPTLDRDPRFLARFHEQYTIRDIPGQSVHLYRVVAGRVLEIEISQLGPPQKKAFTIGEGMSLGASGVN